MSKKYKKLLIETFLKRQNWQKPMEEEHLLRKLEVYRDYRKIRKALKNLRNDGVLILGRSSNRKVYTINIKRLRKLQEKYN